MTLLTGRRAARETALLMLFAVDARKLDAPDDVIGPYAENLRDDEEVLAGLFAHEDDDDDNEPDPAKIRHARHLMSSGPHWAFAERLVRGVMDHTSAIDTLIAKYSVNWKVHRMSRVDRNVLRLAAYELTFEPDVPVRATLNEAIEMAKRYGSEESGKFVNGILDRVAQELERV
jgi:N utilization substance protein B